MQGCKIMNKPYSSHECLLNVRVLRIKESFTFVKHFFFCPEAVVDVCVCVKICYIISIYFIFIDTYRIYFSLIKFAYIYSINSITVSLSYYES
jgi:hypothetical protein